MTTNPGKNNVVTWPGSHKEEFCSKGTALDISIPSQELRNSTTSGILQSHHTHLEHLEQV